MTRLTDAEKSHARPNIVPWPPIVLLAAIVTGWLLGSVLPSLAGQAMIGHFPLTKVQPWLGWLLVGLAIAMDIWVFAIFRKHKTNIRPDRPAVSLVTSGPFAYSRNPIYVGNVAIILGMALVIGSVWYLLLTPMIYLLIREMAIKREEAHMAARFGDAWVGYTTKVRRWL